MASNFSLLRPQVQIYFRPRPAIDSSRVSRSHFGGMVRSKCYEHKTKFIEREKLQNCNRQKNLLIGKHNSLLATFFIYYDVLLGKSPLAVFPLMTSYESSKQDENMWELPKENLSSNAPIHLEFTYRMCFYSNYLYIRIVYANWIFQAPSLWNEGEARYKFGIQRSSHQDASLLTFYHQPRVSYTN